MDRRLGDKVTDLIFRVEQFDPEFLYYLGRRWQLDRAADDPRRPRPSRAGRRRRGGRTSAPQQEAAIAASQQAGEKKHEPVRNVGKKVGRNDPARADRVKSSKPAACARKPRATLLIAGRGHSRSSGGAGIVAVGRRCLEPCSSQRSSPSGDPRRIASRPDGMRRSVGVRERLASSVRPAWPGRGTGTPGC